MIDARIGHQNVEAAMTCDDGFDGIFYGMLVGHIEGRDFGLQATTAQSARDAIKRISIEVIECDDCAGLRESFGHSQSKPTRGACNERNTSSEREQLLPGSHVRHSTILPAFLTLEQGGGLDTRAAGCPSESPTSPPSKDNGYECGAICRFRDEMTAMGQERRFSTDCRWSAKPLIATARADIGAYGAFSPPR